MKKRVLSILLTMCMGLALLPVTAFAEPDGVEINETNFPDYYFRTIFVSEFDKDGDGFLSADEIDAVTSIDCSYVGPLNSVKGIEYFPALTVLKCVDNQISSLDISQNPNLTDLDCSINNLTFLDVSLNPNLINLNCSYNPLISIDISNNFNLLELSCVFNQLTSLDVSNNPNLTHLNCSCNPLISIDISNNFNLLELSCVSNQLTSLDVSHNPNLINLSCFLNQLTSLDVSNNPNLINLLCDNNQLSSLDVSMNSCLKVLSCGDNQRTFTDINNGMIDLSALPGFDVNKTSNWNGGTVNGNILYVDDNVETVTYTYDCGNNHSEMFTFIIASNSSVESVKINETNFPDYYFRTIFVSQFDNDSDGFLSAAEIAAVTSIDCSYVGPMYSVKGIEYFPALTVLKCSGNQISSLDISQNPNLIELDCSNNILTSLDVSQNPNLEILSCDVNQLTSLDVSQNPNLSLLICVLNKRAFTDINNGMIDLSALPGFDVNKTSNWNGGTVNGNILYVDDNAETVTYTYDCGNNHSEMFTFIIASNVPADYTVTYQYGDQMVSDTMIHGSDLALRSDIFTKTGFKQIGWATTDGGDVSYELGGTYADKASITLYPVWSEMSDYAVSFSTNGGSEVKNKVNVKWTDKVLNEVTAPTKDGYIFTGWICGDATVNENTTYAELAVKDTVKSVTLTAQYQAVQKPEMIEGESATVVEGENVTMTFRSNAAFSDFIRVELDGEVLDEKNYTKKEGSTIIILNADFVATLTPGEHTLSIVSGGASAGVATAKFTVNTKTTESTSSENSVQTGDNSNLALWFSLLAISGVGLAGTMIFNKKRTKDNQ